MERAEKLAVRKAAHSFASASYKWITTCIFTSRQIEPDGDPPHCGREGEQITPRQKRIGLMHGQIWIDSETGAAVHQTGRFVKQPPVFVRRTEVVRDTEVRAGTGPSRVTHLTIETRMFGRADLTITERPLKPVESEVAQQAH
jgi:hypothetical protein